MKILTISLCLLLWSGLTFSQISNFETPVSIRTDGNDPDANAILDIQSNSKGVLIPRMTTMQRTDIATPPEGLLVFDTDNASFWFFNGSTWQDLSNELWSEGAGSNIYYNAGHVGIGLTVPTLPLDVYSNYSTAKVQSIGLTSGDKTGLNVLVSNADFVSALDELIGINTTAVGSDGMNIALKATSNDVGDYAAIFDGTVLLSDEGKSLNMVTITPATGVSGDSSALFFAEDDDADFGVYWLYDGVGNDFELHGKSASTIGKLFEIDRDDAKVSIANGAIILDPDFGGDSRIITDEIEIKGGSDLAELFDVNANEFSKVTPGLIVSIDPDNPGQLKISNAVNDRLVVGVLSGANGIEPGMLMGQEGTIAYGAHPVSLSGRAYVKANDSNGQINPGDFVCSSSLPGEAMRVTDIGLSQGSILGKAMTGIDKDGYVLLLINLQ